MSRFYKYILFVLSLHLCMIASAQKTTVWIVRHAEKDTAFINRQDPALTATGQQRALDLAAYLQNENIIKDSFNLKLKLIFSIHFYKCIKLIKNSLIYYKK